MSPRLRSAVSLVAMLVLLTGAPAPPVRACAFDGGAAAGLFDGSFEALYPKSSVVYFAIMDAIDQGVLDRSEFQTIVPGPSGYWRAVGRLESIQERLSAVSSGWSQPEAAISVVFIESNLWARLEPGPRRWELTVHTLGAREGNLVVVTSEGGIAAVMDGRLSAKVAFDRGLIAIDGDELRRNAVQEFFVTAFGPVASSSSGPRGARNARPVRFFGPPR
jgi:hypothetical protein